MLLIFAETGSEAYRNSQKGEGLQQNMGFLLEIFSAFFKIGAFTFGGGHAMVPLIQKEVVDEKGWIEAEDFIDILALAQTAPGPVAANTSVFVGYKLVGVPGAVWALLGTVLPSFMVILAIAMYFTRIADSLIIQAAFSGIRPAVVALVASAAINIGKTAVRDLKGITICVLAFLAVAIIGVHPIPVIIGSGILGYVLFKDEEASRLNNRTE